MDLKLDVLYTAAETHVSGLGKRLMQVVIREESAYLWLIEGNAGAQKFYEKHGFQLDGATKKNTIQDVEVNTYRMVH